MGLVDEGLEALVLQDDRLVGQPGDGLDQLGQPFVARGDLGELAENLLSTALKLALAVDQQRDD